MIERQKKKWFNKDFVETVHQAQTAAVINVVSQEGEKGRVCKFHPASLSK